MTATITKLKPAKLPATKLPATKPAKPGIAALRAARQTQLATYGVGAVALTLTGLSLTHLTRGIASVTGGGTFESAAMAVGIDLGFVALEIAQIVKLPDASARVVARYAHPAIVGTMLASAALNAFGFAEGARGLMVYPAIALGAAIPALIYALTRVAVAMAK